MIISHEKYCMNLSIWNFETLSVNIYESCEECIIHTIPQHDCLMVCENMGSHHNYYVKNKIYFKIGSIQIQAIWGRVNLAVLNSPRARFRTP